MPFASHLEFKATIYWIEWNIKTSVYWIITDNPVGLSDVNSSLGYIKPIAKAENTCCQEGTVLNIYKRNDSSPW